MKPALSLIFFAGVFIAFLTSMELGDVWWHLKTGEWIWQNKTIPHVDPFSLAGGGDSQVLKAFWLCQLMLYAVQSLGGMYGLIVLKAFLFTSTFLLLNSSLKARGLKTPLRYIVLLPSIFAATFYDEIRPQTFSFLFFALVLYLLEGGRASSGLGGTATAFPSCNDSNVRWLKGLWLKLKGSTAILPLIMLVWANMHAGFVIGIALIAYYVLSNFASSLKSRIFPGQAVPCLISIAISGLNPNGFKPILLTVGMLRDSAKGDVAIHEHLPVKEFISFTGQGALYVLIIALISAGLMSFIISVIKIRRLNIYQLFLFLSLASASIISFRAGMFFSIIASITIGKNLAYITGGGHRPLYERILKGAHRAILVWGSAALTAIGVVAVIYFVLIPRTILRVPAVNENLIPVKVANFIKSEALPGNIYNPYEWGGYMIWRLYPEYRVFIDGRAVGLLKEYIDVLEGKPSWKEILDRHRVNTVVYWPLLPYQGRVPAIVFQLLRDDGWSPVYWDLQGIAFVRASLAKKPISKNHIWELLTSLISANITHSPSEPKNYIALGIVYLERGMKHDAQQAFIKAFALDPQNKEVIFYLQILK